MAIEYYLGLMAGTSLDAVDCAIVSFDSENATNIKHKPTLNFQLIHTYSYPLDSAIRKKLLSLTQPQANELELLMEMDVAMGELFAKACLNALSQTQLTADQIHAIGSHGQTIRHFPQGKFRTTLQIGDANIIAERTGITTICDFRRRDMAIGGQGAPLVPPFHAELFSSPDWNRCVVNIGGIANITTLSTNIHQDVYGFDTGPGNGLIDLWCERAFQIPFDHSGKLAKKGRLIPHLFENMLSDHFFALSHPKSTGREYFGEKWLLKHIVPVLDKQGIKLFDSIDSKIIYPLSQQHQSLFLNILTTITELTAFTICQSIKRVMPEIEEVLVCGGGSKNAYVMDRIQELINNSTSAENRDKFESEVSKKISVLPTENYGLPADWVESTAFAWLAMKTRHNQAGNLPSVTGASHPIVLGAIYPGTASPSNR